MHDSYLKKLTFVLTAHLTRNVRTPIAVGLVDLADTDYLVQL